VRKPYAQGLRDAFAKFGFHANVSDDEAKEIERQHHHGMTAHQLAALMVGGKILAHNALTRYGDKLPPMRWLGQQFAGMGYRAGEQGRPMLSRPIREIGALAIDPHMVGAYEKGHAAGQVGGVVPQAMHHLGDFVNDPRVQAAIKDRPHMANVSSFIQGIPTESKGFAKAVDYMHSPGMAANAAGEGISNLAGKAVGGIKNMFSKGQVP
jgi:hypothetical protein